MKPTRNLNAILGRLSSDSIDPVTKDFVKKSVKSSSSLIVIADQMSAALALRTLTAGLGASKVVRLDAKFPSFQRSMDKCIKSLKRKGASGCDAIVLDSIHMADSLQIAALLNAERSRCLIGLSVEPPDHALLRFKTLSIPTVRIDPTCGLDASPEEDVYDEDDGKRVTDGKKKELASRIIACVLSGDGRSVKEALVLGASPNTKVGDMYSVDADTTVLHLACKMGHDQVVVVLLDKGADPNIRENKTGMTPLHISAILDDTASMRALIKAGANVTIKSKEGFTPIQTASAVGSKSAVDLLMPYSGGKTAS